MPECARTHLQQSRISKFSGGGPPNPPLQWEGREGRRREGEEKWVEGGGSREGTGGALDMGSAAPLETSSGSAPAGGPSGTYILKS